YNLYLLGRFHLNRRTEDELKKAITYFEQTVRIDEKFASAYAGIADANHYLAIYDIAPPRERMPEVRTMALKALTIQPDLAEAHASLGQLHLYYNWQPTEAAKEYRRAIELDPGYANAHLWYGVYLSTFGENAAAIRELDRADRLDPLSPAIRNDKSFFS